MVSVLARMSRKSMALTRSMSGACTEVSIPVPWGAIAGKHWRGREAEARDPGQGTQQWLVLHGLLDNAGSFDSLVPLLTSALPSHSFLCLDYPGHGLSSHLPPGQMYHPLECIRYIRLGILFNIMQAKK